MKPQRFREHVEALEAVMLDIRTGASPDEVLAVVEHVFKRIAWKPVPQAPETRSDALGCGTLTLVARIEVQR